MENKEDILKRIKSNEPEVLTETFRLIKENGDMSIVSSLLDLLNSQPDHTIITQIVNLLADIKDKAIRNLLIHQIRETKKADIKALLVRVCWESSIDYSDHADLFLKIMLEDDFIVAIEASTAIENMMHHINEEKRKEFSATLKSIRNPDEQRKFLIEPILEMLEE